MSPQKGTRLRKQAEIALNHVMTPASSCGEHPNAYRSLNPISSPNARAGAVYEGGGNTINNTNTTGDNLNNLNPNQNLNQSHSGPSHQARSISPHARVNLGPVYGSATYSQGGQGYPGNVPGTGGLDLNRKALQQSMMNSYVQNGMIQIGGGQQQQGQQGPNLNSSLGNSPSPRELMAHNYGPGYQQTVGHPNSIFGGRELIGNSYGAHFDKLLEQEKALTGAGVGSPGREQQGNLNFGQQQNHPFGGYQQLHSPTHSPQHGGRDRSQTGTGAGGPGNSKKGRFYPGCGQTHVPDTLTCKMCAEPMSKMEAKKLPGCGHTFHFDCIDPFFRRELQRKTGVTTLRCPFCQALAVPSIDYLVQERKRKLLEDRKGIKGMNNTSQTQTLTSQQQKNKSQQTSQSSKFGIMSPRRRLAHNLEKFENRQDYYNNVVDVLVSSENPNETYQSINTDLEKLREARREKFRAYREYAEAEERRNEVPWETETDEIENGTDNYNSKEKGNSESQKDNNNTNDTSAQNKSQSQSPEKTVSPTKNKDKLGIFGTMFKSPRSGTDDDDNNNKSYYDTVMDSIYTPREYYYGQQDNTRVVNAYSNPYAAASSLMQQQQQLQHSISRSESDNLNHNINQTVKDQKDERDRLIQRVAPQNQEIAMTGANVQAGLVAQGLVPQLDLSQAINNMVNDSQQQQQFSSPRDRERERVHEDQRRKEERENLGGDLKLQQFKLNFVIGRKDFVRRRDPDEETSPALAALAQLKEVTPPVSARVIKQQQLQALERKEREVSLNNQRMLQQQKRASIQMQNLQQQQQQGQNNDGSQGADQGMKSMELSGGQKRVSINALEGQGSQGLQSQSQQGGNTNISVDGLGGDRSQRSARRSQQGGSGSGPGTSREVSSQSLSRRQRRESNENLNNRSSQQSPGSPSSPGGRGHMNQTQQTLMQSASHKVGKLDLVMPPRAALQGLTAPIRRKNGAISGFAKALRAEVKQIELRQQVGGKLEELLAAEQQQNDMLTSDGMNLGNNNNEISENYNDTGRYGSNIKSGRGDQGHHHHPGHSAKKKNDGVSAAKKNQNLGGGKGKTLISAAGNQRTAPIKGSKEGNAKK